MNDIVTRIKVFLQSMGIANSAFADVCGIPRPSLSQMLNGRNRKVSNEVIDKIHAAYPELNMMWLMFGDGDMLASNNSGGDSENPQHAENAFPGNALNNAAKEQHVQQSINFDDVDKPGQAPFIARKPQNTQRQNSTPESVAALARGKVAAQQTRQSAGRQITQILIIFSDGSSQIITP